ncbi:MAG: hypothetical protein HGGPFJEG_03165 [Ignavibacteria bacterium]|nr:hypothetical protein [Ignavibacteria bacterium]
MPHIKDNAIGVIVYYKLEDSLIFLLLKHRKGHWSFAKGHSEPEESPIQTALRELHEEAGIFNLKFITGEPLLKEKYSFVNKKLLKVKKKVKYFIAETFDMNVKIDNHEITDYKWCSLEESANVLTFGQSLEILNRASKFIFKHSEELSKTI